MKRIFSIAILATVSLFLFSACLEEFENLPHSPDDPEVIILRPSPEIELFAAHIAAMDIDVARGAKKSNFLQQYESYTEIDNPYVLDGWWLIFSANMDLRDFQFFALSLACGPWIEYDWPHIYPNYFYYIGVLGSLAVLPVGEAVVVPWHAGGTFSDFGISFLDETGQRRNFTLNASQDNYGSPIIFLEFVDYRLHCPNCMPSAPLTVVDIPQGSEPAEFLNWGSDFVALYTDTAIEDLRIISVIPYYEASFDDGWQFVRHHAYTWTRHTIDLLPEEPIVMAWQADGRYVSGGGLDGLSFVDTDGHERFFILQQNDGMTYLEEFVNEPHSFSGPNITIVRPSPEIELVAAWITDQQGDVHAIRNNFLQQFDFYTEFDNPFVTLEGLWLAFGANMDLRDFQFFGLGHVCNPWVDDEWHPFYVGTMIGSQDILSFGIPLVVPWHPGGTLPSFGISFLDENDQRRNFSLNSNEGSGFPPMFILEFVDREYCPYCTGSE